MIFILILSGHFNEQWSALVRISRSRIYSKDFDSEKEGDSIVIINDDTMMRVKLRQVFHCCISQKVI
jgi:hypothetical protein